MASTKLNDGIPRSTMHMGAGSFTLTSSLNGQVSRVDLNKEHRGRSWAISEFLCSLHGIASKEPPTRRRPVGAKRTHKSVPPIGNLAVIDLQAAM